MTKEIEVKILEINPEKIVAKLKELGAEKTGSGVVDVTAFDYPDDRLIKKGSFIRVRTFHDKSELLLKTPITSEGGFKVMEEIETKVDDYEETCRIFEVLGMKIFAKHDKYRAAYKLGDIKFEIDKIAGIPWFMEVEATTEEDVVKGVELLGFKMSDTHAIGQKTVCEKYGIPDHSFFSFKDTDESPDYDHLFK